MEIKAKEILGAILGFIPGVSTITGAIKACIYYKHTKKNVENYVNADKTATKIGTVVSDTLMSPKGIIYREEKALWKASIVEMIPGINIVAAIYSTNCLVNLNEARKAEKNPNEYLIKKYGLNDQQKNTTILNALKIIDNILTPRWMSEPTKKDIAEGFIKWISKNTDEENNSVNMLKNYVKEKIEKTDAEIKKLENKISAIEQKNEATFEVRRDDRNLKLEKYKSFLYNYKSLNKLYVDLQDQLKGTFSLKNNF